MALREYDEETLKPTVSTTWSTNCSGSTAISTTTGNLLQKARRLDIGVRYKHARGELRNWLPYSYERTSAFGGITGRRYSVTDYCPKYSDWGNFIGYGEGPAKTVQSHYYSQTFNGYSDIGANQTLNETNAIAQAKLFASLKEERTQWQFAVTLGEGRETAAHIASTARRLANGFLSFRKGNIKEAWRHLRGRDAVPVRHQESFRTLRKKAGGNQNWRDDASSAWMEFTYAWKPLLGDVDSAAKYLAQKSVDRSYALYRVSRSHRIRQQSETYYQPGGPDYPKEKWLTNDMSHVRHTYEVYPDFLRKPSTLNELGFTDPATVAWELLPLSFVVDWFVNVGQVLESLHEFQQWGTKRGLTSYRNYRSQERIRVKNYTGNLSNYVQTGGPQTFIRVLCDRSLQGALPTAVPLRVKVSNPFDLQTGQMASAVVLLRYAFK